VLCHGGWIWDLSLIVEIVTDRRICKDCRIVGRGWVFCFGSQAISGTIYESLLYCRGIRKIVVCVFQKCPGVPRQGPHNAIRLVLRSSLPVKGLPRNMILKVSLLVKGLPRNVEILNVSLLVKKGLPRKHSYQRI
jgi:hypothetical protein